MKYAVRFSWTLQRRTSPVFFCLVLLSPLLLASCLFETESAQSNYPTHFDLTLLRNAVNPLTKWYSMDNSKSLVGLKFAFHSTNYAWEVDSNVEAFHSQSGVYPAIVGAYFDFFSQPQNLKIFLDAVHAKGCVPYVTLDPKHFSSTNDLPEQKKFLAKIIQGEFDAKLMEMAQVLRDFKFPVLFRYAHEMNGDWYPYGGGGDANGDGIADGPANYVSAWRYTHDLFMRNGTVNLLWIFCPNAEDFPAVPGNRPFRYFPGSNYVDLIFVDAYEHHKKRKQTLEEALDYFYNEMGNFFESKRALGDSLMLPFGVGEFGTTQSDIEAKASWYNHALGFIAVDDRIKFHILYNVQNSTEDFSLQTLGDRVKAAFQQARFQLQLFAFALNG